VARTVKNKYVKPWNEGFKCWLPQVGVMLLQDNYHALRKELMRYMLKNKLDFGPINILIDECICAALEKENRGPRVFCEDGNAPVHPDEVERRGLEGDPRGPKISRGNSGSDAYAWKQLHIAALDGRLDQAFVKRFVGRIGCGVCRSHADAFVAKNPVSPTDPFGWTVVFHNYVNATLKRPEMDVEAARELWSKIH